MINQITDTFLLLDKKQKKNFLIICMLICFGSFLEFFSLFVIYQTIKFFSDAQKFLIEDSFFKEIFIFFFNNNFSIINFVIFLVAIYFIKFIYFIIMYYKQFKYSSYIAYEMSSKILKKYMNSSLKFHSENETSKLLRNVRDEVGQFGIGGVQQLIILMNELVIFMAILTLLGIYETKFLIISFSCFATVGFVYYLSVVNLFRKYGKKRQYFAAKVTKYSLETLYGIKNIKLFNAGYFFLDGFKSNAKKYADAIKITTTLNQVPRIGLELITVLIVCIVLIYIFNPDSLDKEFLPSAGLFIIAAFKLIPSISKMLNSLNILNYSYPSIQVLKKELNRNDLLDHDLDIVKNKFSFKKKIEFKNVSFDFKERKKNLLTTINLEIEKNSAIGLMGDSGSGKSTLIDLLTGIYEPQIGKIFVDGQDINEIKKGWRDIICIVPQKIFLTNDTIKKKYCFWYR